MENPEKSLADKSFPHFPQTFPQVAKCPGILSSVNIKILYYQNFNPIFCPIIILTTAFLTVKNFFLTGLDPGFGGQTGWKS